MPHIVLQETIPDPMEWIVSRPLPQTLMKEVLRFVKKSRWLQDIDLSAKKGTCFVHTSLAWGSDNAAGELVLHSLP
jgi:hypothetical protein